MCYVPCADAFPEARAGWIDGVDALTGRHRRPPRRRSPAPPGMTIWNSGVPVIRSTPP